jgi:hypothetical protein
MISLLKRLTRKHGLKDAIVVVSGLPRCGTSMMMQMLEAGGMEIITDNIRKADEDNPRGYYEFEKVKKIKEDTSWLDSCYGKVFKMVSALLYHLPEGRKYKVIFMKRNIQEMLESQNVMLARMGKKTDDVNDKHMAENLDQHLRKVGDWLAKQGHIDVIYIHYSKVVKNPIENAKAVSRFLKGVPDVDKMAKAVKKSLYRQRREDTPASP